MSAVKLTQTELDDAVAAYEWWRTHSDVEPFYAVLDAAVATRLHACGCTNATHGEADRG